MALTKKQAQSKLEALIREDRDVRRWNESFWTMGQMYDSGKHWGYTVPNSAGVDVRHLRQIVNPNRDDVRVVMDKTHENTVRIRSMLQPQRIAMKLKPAADTPEGQVLANAGQVWLESHLAEIHALDVLRTRDTPRCVFGTVGVRRTLRQTAPPMPVEDDEDPDLQFRQWSIGWELVLPWELLRETSAKSLHPYRDEEIIAHFKPRSLEWIERNFGIKIDKDKADQLGRLQDYQQQMRQAGWGSGQAHFSSKEPGVLFYECFFKDPDQGDQWAWMLQGYTSSAEKNSPLHVVGFYRNPFYGLPIELFWFDEQAESPWARGVPHVLMAGQNITNIAWTWLCRTMQQGAGKWVFEDGTIENKAVLNNRVDVPIIFKRNPQYTTTPFPPKREMPPQISPASMNILQMAPQWMGEALNISDVQKGQVSKRGEPAEAIRLRMDAASMPIDSLRTSDELAMGRLLFGTLVDGVRHSHVGQLIETVRGAVPERHIQLLKGADLARALKAAIVLPSMSRPKTPGQVEEQIISLATAQLIDPDTALWEVGRKANTWVLTKQQHAYDKQISELDAMQQGQPAPVSIADSHQYHMRTIEEFADSPQWLTLEPQVQQMILQHYAQHKQAMMIMAMGDSAQQQGPQQQAMPSPPSEAVEQLSASRLGATGPGIGAF